MEDITEKRAPRLRTILIVGAAAALSGIVVATIILLNASRITPGTSSPANPHAADDIGFVDVRATVFGGTSSDPVAECRQWSSEPPEFHGDVVTFAISWEAAGSDRADVFSSDGGQWPAKAASDIVYVTFECWSAAYEARQVSLSLTALSRAVPIDTAVVEIRADSAPEVGF